MCVEYRKQQIVHVILNSVKSVNLEYYSITISFTHKVSQLRSFQYLHITFSPVYAFAFRVSCFSFDSNDISLENVHHQQFPLNSRCSNTGNELKYSLHYSFMTEEFNI